MDVFLAVVVSVAGTWIGAIGIGVISVGLKLNNTVQRLGVLVEELTRDRDRHAAELSMLRESRSDLVERISVLECRSSNGTHEET